MNTFFALSLQITIFTILLTFNSATAQGTFDFDPVPPESQDFSAEKLESLGSFLTQAGSSSLLILKNGQVVYEWGATKRKHTVHSIRKALINSLYGIYVSNGAIDTTATIGQLGIDDIAPPLSESERLATVADLLRSRSGIYHPSAATNQAMLEQLPPRGTHKPNQAYFYNNWDFNVLGFILESITGKSIYDLFYEDIAKPLGMQYANDYVSIYAETETNGVPQTDGFYQYDRTKSHYPAYHFRLSARDLALYGQLYLNNGTWDGKQIIPKEWIKRSTKAHSVYNENYGIAYGMLWNVLMETETRKSKSFFHTGVGIHMLGIYPASNVVLVHRVDTEEDYNFSQGDFYKMISLVWDAEIK